MEEVRKLIRENNLEEASRILNAAIEKDPRCAEYYYLLGNVYRKQSDFRRSLNNYLKAIELDPESPAQEAYKMTMDILNFYNKDMFNH
ncbi:MAG: tetratricopeptide repeat protein [Tannerellaceae bacterium]|nr:tetratricopeptide repeat protein [Tannerellaceae bacterium]MCD8043042.1 tetratricopeptide repeat protein [Tannerellaceae bacterium]